MPINIRNEYLNDPRLMQVQLLAKAGSSTAPVQSGVEAFARALQGGLAGYQSRQLKDEYESRADDYSKTMADALAAGSGGERTNLPGPSADGTAGYTRPAMKPDSDAMLAILAGNPDTAEMASNLKMKQMEQQLKPVSPVSVAAGSSLVNPQTGEAIYTAPQAEMTPYQREFLDVQRERNNLKDTDTGKPPTGFRWAEDGQSLEPIPGGPATQVSPELAARLGIAQKFLKEAPELKKAVAEGKATGAIDYLTGAAGFGESGQLARRISDGADALQRMLTGAGMPASEAADYTNRFRVSARDNSDTLSDKLSNLENILNEQLAMATRGRGGATPNQPSGQHQATNYRDKYGLE